MSASGTTARIDLETFAVSALGGVAGQGFAIELRQEHLIGVGLENGEAVVAAYSADTLGELNGSVRTRALTEPQRFIAGTSYGYVVDRLGFSTIDLASMTIAHDEPSAQRGWHDLALDSEERAVACMGAAVSESDAALYDVGDAQSPYRFLRRFPADEPAGVLAIAAGLAYVTHADGRLDVVRYVDREQNGTGPSITLAAGSTVDAQTSEVEAGSVVSVLAAVTDDRQVSHVTFSIDGDEQRSDTSYPYETAFRVPHSRVGETVTVSATAFDTAGNASFTTLALQVVQDTTAPRVLEAIPNVPVRLATPRIAVSFSEPIDAATAAVSLVGHGPDLEFGTADDESIDVDLSLENAPRGRDQILYAFPQSRLTVGYYEGRIPTTVTDAAGNALADEFVWRFFVGAETPVVELQPGGRIVDDLGATSSLSIALVVEEGKTYLIELSTNADDANFELRSTAQLLVESGTFSRNAGALIAFEALTTGYYSFALTGTSGSVDVRFFEANPLEVGVASAAVFENTGQIDRWVFQAVAGDVRSAAVISPAASGRISWSVVDSVTSVQRAGTGGPYSATEPFGIERDGVHVLRVEAIDASLIGEYTISLSDVPPPIPVVHDGLVSQASVELGSERPFFAVQFDPSRPIAVKLSSDDGLHAWLRVRLPTADPFYERPFLRAGVTPNWHVGDRSNPTGTIEPLRFTEPGEYLFQIQPSGLGQPTGTCRLEISRPPATSVAVDGTLSAWRSQNPFAFHRYDVDAPVGTPFVVHTEARDSASGGITTRLVDDLGVTRRTVSSINFFGAASHSTAPLRVLDEGVSIEQFWGSHSGEYRFSIVPVAPPSTLSLPGGMAGVIQTVGERHYRRFHANAGDTLEMDVNFLVDNDNPDFGLWGRVRIWVESTDFILDSVIVRIREIRGGTDSFEVPLPRTGSYIIEVDGEAPAGSTRGHETGGYTASLRIR